MIPCFSLPTLAPSVPRTMLSRTGSTFAPALASMLVEADALEFPRGLREADLSSESALVQRGLENWWQRICSPLTLFKWHLRVEEKPAEHIGNSWVPGTSEQVFMMLTDGHGAIEDVPRFNLEAHVNKLEKECAGFGETVLAALYDALRLIPGVHTPQDTIGMASFHYWNGESDETEVLQWYIDECEDGSLNTLDDARGVYEGLTRGWMDKHIPPWVQYPKRRRTRSDIASRIHSRRARCVIAALDEMAAAARAKPLHIPSLEAVDGFPLGVSMFLHWGNADVTYRVFDDTAQDAWNSGDAHEYLHADVIALQTLPNRTPNRTPSHPRNEPARRASRSHPTHPVREWQRALGNMVNLARATENLIRAIGEPCD